MTTNPTPRHDAARLERTYDAPAELIWELWTTTEGLEKWFAPEGFETRVRELDLRPGGHLRYTMTATAAEQVAFMQSIGAPIAVELRKTFTEVARPTRLAYLTLVDFVPGHEPYDHLTTIDIASAGDRTDVVLTMDPFHDDPWTQGSVEHRRNELDNLAAVIGRRRNRPASRPQEER
ncbi:MAG TPA: SRPBCC domain-containing protein [Gaiellales bacterium]|nr:SRPBCC domain-containing protein [Gaiellales bacterium]